MLFQPFNKATKRETPKYVEAETQEGIFKQKAKQQENALRSQNMLGAAELYNQGMGDKSPIADYMFGTEGSTTAPAGGAPVEPVSAPVTGEASATAVQGGTELAPLTFQSAAGTGANAIPLAAETAAGAGAGAGAAGAGTAGTGAAGAGAGTGALAAMGPVGWAALAAAALMAMKNR